MEEQQPPELERVDEGRPVLPYMPPRDDTRRLSAEMVRLVLGAAMTGLGIIGWVFIALVSTVGIRPVPGTLPSYVTPLVTGAAILAVLLATAAVLWLRHRSLAFVKGSLIGLGLAVLIEGLCFVAISG